MLVLQARRAFERHGAANVVVGFLQFLARKAERARFFVHESFIEFAHPLPVFRVDLVMPLLQPGKKLEQTGKKRSQTLLAPALRFLHLDIVGG